MTARIKNRNALPKYQVLWSKGGDEMNQHQYLSKNPKSRSRKEEIRMSYIDFDFNAASTPRTFKTSGEHKKYDTHKTSSTSNIASATSFLSLLAKKVDQLLKIVKMVSKVCEGIKMILQVILRLKNDASFRYKSETLRFHEVFA